MSIICANVLDPLLQLMKGGLPSFYPNYAYHSGAIKKPGITQHPVPPAKQSANKIILNSVKPKFMTPSSTPRALSQWPKSLEWARAAC